MENKNRHGFFAPFIVSMLVLIVTALLLRYFYSKTFYIPFLLIALTLLLPTALSLIAWLFHRDLKEPPRPAPRKRRPPEGIGGSPGVSAGAPDAGAVLQATGEVPSAGQGLHGATGAGALNEETPCTNAVACESAEEGSCACEHMHTGTNASVTAGKNALAQENASAEAHRAAHERKLRHPTGEDARRWGAFFRYWLVRAYNRTRGALRLLCMLISFGTFGYSFFTTIGGRTDGYLMGFRYPIFLALLFVAFVILEKCIKHIETDDTFDRALLRNVRSAMAVGRLMMLFGIAACVVRTLGSYDLQRYLIYIYIAIFCYQAVFLLFALAVRLIRRELSVAPGFTVPVPFVVSNDDDLSFVSYLEESTGITMRSLWSIKFIRHILPYTVIAVAMCFWLSTSIVQVEPNQRGAVYRLGVLQSETLSPGLHFTFPAPIDKVEIYDTETVNKMTIGYRSEEAGDNIWTAAHGDEEYKLLLGNGNEVVSINLRLEYKIADLDKYIRNSACAECILEAMAYELVTDRTISTDLNTLLTADRAEFSATFRDELVEKINAYGTGIEVVSVVLESIHPPVEIAETYQKMVSAEIQAEEYILEAEGSAATVVANAEITRALTIGDAKSAYYTQVATASAGVAEFMAAVEAYSTYPEAYKYQKYLEAVATAYSNARIVIVGDGVDTKNLYFGNLVIG